MFLETKRSGINTMFVYYVFKIGIKLHLLLAKGFTSPSIFCTSLMRKYFPSCRRISLGLTTTNRLGKKILHLGQLAVNCITTSRKLTWTRPCHLSCILHSYLIELRSPLNEVDAHVPFWTQYEHRPQKSSRVPHSPWYDTDYIE